jgi:hypothetical protein
MFGYEYGRGLQRAVRESSKQRFETHEQSTPGGYYAHMALECPRPRRWGRRCVVTPGVPMFGEGIDDLPHPGPDGLWATPTPVWEATEFSLDGDAALSWLSQRCVRTIDSGREQYNHSENSSEGIDSSDQLIGCPHNKRHYGTQL